MRKLIIVLILLPFLITPAYAIELKAPEVPESGADWMPESTASFPDALMELLHKALLTLQPDLADAAQISITVTCIIMALSMLQSFSGTLQRIASAAGAAAIASALLNDTNSLIRLGTTTITELSDYGKLLLPVMTAAMASQGGTTASTMLYAGTAAFDIVLSSLISNFLVPAVYCFLAIATANSAFGEDILTRLRDFIKWLITWTLKTLLTVYTTYMGISGVVSGTTDAVALKAAKFTISSVVPVVGGILSDASESVLVSAGLVKNAAGIYGIIAVLAVFLAPFLKIGAHYAVLKLTSALCSLFGTKQLTTLIEDFSTAMGFILAMTGTTCLLVLISTICFLKGVG